MSDLPVLELQNITKSFGPVTVLQDVDFAVEPGEVHALVGENGAGKSTLMKVAAGIYQADAGRILVSGRDVRHRGPQDAQREGIAMVHQELSLAPDVSIAENIFSGREPVRRGLVAWRELERRTVALLREFGLELDPTEPISSLGIGHRQVIEILKAVSANPKIIIFDEPTSALETRETAAVLDTISKLAERGIGVVYISHRIEEVLKVASRVTVLRDGLLVWTRPVGDLKREDIVNAMVGRELSALYPPRATELCEEVLRVEGLTREPHFQDVSFTLSAAEILGFSGLVGCGRTEVMLTLFGAVRPDAGRIVVDGKPRRFRSVSDAISAGIAYLPEDRKSQGLFLDHSLRENILSGNLNACSRGVVVSYALSERLAFTYCGLLDIKARDTDQEVRSLSGGNQQKVLLARWMAAQPRILIVDEPTRGVDVGAKGEIHRMLREYATAGNGVIVVSSEMPEILGLCDRIIVLQEGRVAGVVPGATATEEQLIALAVR